MAGGADATFQMDLADLKNSPEVRESATYKFFLVVVNVFDRFTYARNLKTKEPKEVHAALASILTAESVLSLHSLFVHNLWLF